MGRTALNVNDSMLAEQVPHANESLGQKHLTQMITAIYLQIKCKKSGH